MRTEDQGQKTERPFTHTPTHAMRCPHCATDNEEGAAVCENCDTPLTAYGGQVTGAVSEATLRKLERLAVRPPVVPMAAALDVLLVVVGPLWTLVGRFAARPAVNAEGTNYAGAAFGAVGVLFSAIVLVPVAVALAVVAWGVMAHRTWAWTAQAFLLLVVAVIGLTGWLVPSLFLRLLLSAGAAVVGYLWVKEDARQWYGV